MALETWEIRWFGEGEPPAPLQELFAGARPRPTRTDTYLRLSTTFHPETPNDQVEAVSCQV